VDTRVERDDDESGERYPTLSEAGRRMISFMRDHASAPIWRNQSGNRLLADEVERVRAFEAEMAHAAIDWQVGRPPGWVGEFVDRVYREVPFFRRQGAAPRRLEDVPPTTRADLARDVAAHVPDSVPLERMMFFNTSGATGHPLLVPSHPVVAASYLAFHKRALADAGVELTHGAGQVGVVLLGYQRRCFTYVSVTPTMGESGLAKINLHESDWRDPADRARYLDAMAPEVLAGDPLSFEALLRLDVSVRPRALLSTAMALNAGMRAALAARFGCPVLDLYSMNEAGPIAVWHERAGGHALLQPRLYVEIVDGEIVLTGGFNPYVPLLRYRTGDFAALREDHVLIGLAGRRPVRFRAADGSWRNNVDVTHALEQFAIAQWTLHQAADGGLALRVLGGETERAGIRAALLALLGRDARLTVDDLVPPDGGKVLQYTTDLEGAEP
jgi:phenylacetate-CoA ligase